MNEWEKMWKDFDRHTFLGEYFFNKIKDKLNEILIEIKIPKKSKVIDVGCGSGRTLLWLRSMGYKNSIGIDHSKSSIQYCINKNNLKKNDVFLMDAFKTKFKNNTFDLVFSEGLIEHFKNFNPVVKEMCRISKRYVIIVQPNHFSFLKFLSNFFYIFYKWRGPPEYTYKIEDFEKSFSKHNFYLKKIKSTLFNGFWILLFEKSKVK